MLELPPSAPPSASLAILCVSITAALAVGLPAARWYAGVRSGADPTATRAATITTAVAVGVWLALTGGLAGTGALVAEPDQFPPPVMPLLGLGTLLTLALALSRFGKCLAESLPLALLVGYQGFRVAVEIMIHRAWTEGVIGEQMTWSGLNFDVVSGVTGLALGLWLWRRGEDQPVPRALLWVWNLLGLGLLLTIVSIAIMSFPGPLMRFEGPPNLWVSTLPFVWLPTIMVTAALFGHVLVARRLLHGHARVTPSRPGKAPAHA